MVLRLLAEKSRASLREGADNTPGRFRKITGTDWVLWWGFQGIQLEKPGTKKSKIRRYEAFAHNLVSFIDRARLNAYPEMRVGVQNLVELASLQPTMNYEAVKLAFERVVDVFVASVSQALPGVDFSDLKRDVRPLRWTEETERKESSVGVYRDDEVVSLEAPKRGPESEIDLDVSNTNVRRQLKQELTRASVRWESFLSRSTGWDFSITAPVLKADTSVYTMVVRATHKGLPSFAQDLNGLVSVQVQESQISISAEIWEGTRASNKKVVVRFDNRGVKLQDAAKLAAVFSYEDLKQVPRW